MEMFLKPAEEVVAAYVGLRIRTIELIRSCDQSVGDLPVPHCPTWSIRQLAAHMVGVPEDILAGRLDGVTTEAWTQEQVDRHRNDSLLDLATIWENMGAIFDPVLAGIPAPVNSQVVFDVATHEHDLRCALGIPGARDAASVAVSTGWILDAAERREQGSANRLRNFGLDNFTLMRVFTGRRSRHQVEALGIDAGYIENWLSTTPFSMAAVDIDE